MAEKMSDELRARLTDWQTKYDAAKADYGEELTKIDAREAWYRGDQAREPLFRGDVVTGDNTVDVPLCRNVCAEMIEDQIDVTIPAPKVTARRKEDEELARLIENMLRNKIDLLPFERIEDLLDRVVKIQGGAAYLVEWDSSVRCGDSMGELCVTPIHPKNLIPQPGVVTSIEDMDYVFVRTPSTRSAVERRFGVVLDETETEAEPEARTSEGEARDNDLVTIVTAYYRSGDAEKTGIGKFSWVNDTVLEDYEDYQARRLRRCAKCGAPEGVRFGSPNAPTVDLANALGLGLPGEDVSGVPGTPGEIPGEGMPGGIPGNLGNIGGAAARRTDGNGTHSEPILRERASEQTDYADEMPVPPFGISRYAEVEEGVCPVCGSTDFVEGDEDYEEIWEPVTLAAGLMFPGAHPEAVSSVGEDGVEIVETRYVPTRVPYFKPGKYPVIPRRNVSVFGRLFGDSDVDKLLSHQNAINRVHKEIIDKLMEGGCFGSLPDNVKFTKEGGFKIVRLKQNDTVDKLGVYSMEAPVGQDMEYLNELYKEAQQAIGVTDAFLGRKDPTASSGKAKELSAAQAAGRMESKRVMKRAAFADLYELMFLFELAYADEPFSVLSKDADGKVVYDSFDRRMFIERDEATGEYRYNTQFLFDVDESSALASNREAMWQELRMNLQTGAFGNPQDPASLVTFWALMEENHYPGAGTIKKKFEELQAKAEAAAAAQAQAAMMQQAGGVPGGAPAPGGAPGLPAGGTALPPGQTI